MRDYRIALTSIVTMPGNESVSTVFYHQAMNGHEVRNHVVQNWPGFMIDSIVEVFPAYTSNNDLIEFEVLG